VTSSLTQLPPHSDEPPFDPEYDAPPREQEASRLPNQNLDAERALLGALILDPSLASDLSLELEPGDFYLLTHQEIWDTAHELAEDPNTPLDPLTLAAQLAKKNQLTRIGGAPYLHTLMQACPITANAAYYARQVRDAARLRKVDEIATQLRQVVTQADPAGIDTALATSLDILDRATARFGPAPHSSTRLTAGDTFILDRPTDVPTAWGNTDNVLWAQGEALLIAGPAGVGKTTIAQQVMLAGIGVRPDALGIPVRPFSRILYIAADRPPQAARSLERMVTEEHRQLLHDHLVIWKGPPERDFAKHPDELTRMCERARADAVVIDSLKDVALGLSDDEVGASLNSAIQRTLVAGVEVLGLHHYRKRSQDHAKKEPASLDELYGSTWITAGCGSVLSMWGAAGDPVVSMRHLKQPAEEFGPVEITHDHDTGTSTIEGRVDLLAQMRMRGGNGLTPTQAACLMTKRDKPNRSDVEKARRTLERLVNTDLAVKQQPLFTGRGHEATYLPAARKDQM
jgi:replicative DNA helicase